MSLHSHGQWLQFGRFGAEQDRIMDRREQSDLENLNGEPERLMEWVGIEKVEQLVAVQVLAVAVEVKE